MSQTFGLSQVFRVTSDPTVTSLNAPKGAVVEYVPSIGTPTLFQKQDDGDTTNWSSIGGGGGGASTALDNLASTAANADISPGIDGTYSLGSDTFKWLNVKAYLFVGGNATASGSGSIASGLASGFGDQVNASSNGAFALGRGEGGFGIVSATNEGAISHGRGSSGNLNATGIGSRSSGRAQNSSVIEASGIGSDAAGFANGGINILAVGDGSIAKGVAEIQNHSSLGKASQAFGNSNIVNSDLGSAFGQGHTNSSFASAIFGQFGIANGNNTSWVSTDPLFVLGNGTGIGSESYAMQVLKDGTLFIKDPSLGAASNGYVWTLSDQVTGQGAWQSGGATTTLNNLGSTAVNADIIAASDNAINLGSSGSGYATVWANTFESSMFNNMTITTQNRTGAAGSVTIMPGTSFGNGVGIGAPVTISGGIGKVSGGDVLLSSGRSFNTSTGIATMQSSDSDPGSSPSAGTGGVFLKSGTTTTKSSPNNGSITGNVYVFSGDANGTGLSGHLFFTTGATLDGASGNISLATSVPTGTGIRGSISMSANGINMVDSLALQMPSNASDPTPIAAGTVYYDSTLNKLKVWNGTAWEVVTSS